jgi:two-component system CheB/CheR fusion protein
MATRAKDRFLAVLSHELRTPLTPVVMAVRLLGRETDLSPRGQELIAMIERNVQVETRLIDELLDLTRIVNGKLHLRREPMSLHLALHAAAGVVSPDLQSREQTLTLHLDAKDDRVDGDFDRLQQAAWNLIKNASKFTPEGGSIAVTTSSNGTDVVVTVTDNGTGIEAEGLERIFDPFTQWGETDRTPSGLGLGLAITRSIIQDHGGHVVAASDGPGSGATFTVTLPLLEAIE